tara:strand:+ start:360 stop:542 length:183 start_codon:yes stop_codon:yes gene_type:complete
MYSLLKKAFAIIIIFLLIYIYGEDILNFLRDISLDDNERASKICLPGLGIICKDSNFDFI